MIYRSRADLGGREGFGRVVPEPEGELFHAAWEPSALALTLAMGATGAWNLDMSRATRETLPDYRTLSYYAIWIEALVKQMAERDLVREDELSRGHMLRPARALNRVLMAADVACTLAKGSPTRRGASRPASFVVGDRVRTREGDVDHHTRLPRYARGKVGTIEHVRGVHVYADDHAQGLGEHPQWLYTVVFDGRELWGKTTNPRLTVSIDAWEPYLTAAS